MLRLLRPRQWTKNVLLFAALVFAERLFDPAALLTCCLAFLAFCLASSSVYVVNDVVDVDRDRLHPDKRNRPIAVGEVQVSAAWLLAAGLTVVSLGLAFWIGAPFGLATLVYLGFSHFYSFVGKNVVILDTLMVAFGFVLRAVAGAIAIDVPYSDWFVLCTFFVALFIALSKRKAELMAAGDSASTRPVLQAYTRESLNAFTVTSMAAAVISYSLYVQAEVEASGGELRTLMGTVPFVILGIFRYSLLVEKGGGEKPEDILLTDRPLQLCLLGFSALAVVAFYLRP